MNHRPSVRPPTTVDLSFIIVNYRSSRELLRCLESIRASEFKGGTEVLVIDNSDVDSGIPIVRETFPEIRLVRNSTNIGFASACNQAARLATGRHLLFVNPDVELNPHTVSRLSAYLDEHPKTGAVGPKVLNPDGTLQFSCRRFPTVWSGLFNRYSWLTRLFPNNRFSRRYLMTDMDHDATQIVDWLSGCCLMVPRVVFQKVGMFDENYFLFIEDVDLCRTIGDQGLDVVYHPATTITHISSKNQWTQFSTIIKRHQGMSHYHRKYIKGNFFTRMALDGLISLRCCLQIIANVFR